MSTAPGDGASAATEPTFIDGLRPYLERAPLAALFLGMSSGFPFAMIGATLASRLAENGIEKKSVTAFALVILAYNLKFLWAWVVEGVRLPILGRLGQRVSWLVFAGLLVIAAVINLGMNDPAADLMAVVRAAILLGIAGATYDIVIDGYRIEILEPRQLGVGAGMSQYGWRIGASGAGALALVVAQRQGWEAAYIACAGFALPAMIAGLVIGEPERHHVIASRHSLRELGTAVAGPFVEFFRRQGAFLVLLFVLLHKIGDTLANLTFRLLFNDLGFSKDEIAIYDVGVGFWALLVGIFVGGILYARLGLKRSVLVSLWLMAVSNLSFAGLRQEAFHRQVALAGVVVEARAPSRRRAGPSASARSLPAWRRRRCPPGCLPRARAARHFAGRLGVDLDHAVEQRRVHDLRDEAGAYALDRVRRGWPPDSTGDATGSTANTFSLGHCFFSTLAQAVMWPPVPTPVIR
jgi:PAT family beta-lactamase induction signal transducer AmpG